MVWIHNKQTNKNKENNNTVRGVVESSLPWFKKKKKGPEGKGAAGGGAKKEQGGETHCSVPSPTRRLRWGWKVSERNEDTVGVR